MTDGFDVEQKIFPENVTLESLIDRIHPKIMRECPRGKNPHKAVRHYIAQYLYALKRGLTEQQAVLEAESRVQVYYNTPK